MNTLSARYPGWCARCKSRYPAGVQITRHNGGWAHAQCSAGAKSDTNIYAGAPPQDTARANRKPDNCWRCGSWVAVGAGVLIYCVEDSGCPVHHDFSGYHVECRDRAACDVARAAAKAARAAKEAAQQARDLARRAALDAIRAASRRDLPWAPPAVETITLGSRLAGSEVIYLGAGLVRYAESSYDDYHEWVAPRTPEIDAALDTLRPLLAARPA